MMLHQDDSRFAWLPGDNRQYDLVVPRRRDQRGFLAVRAVPENGSNVGLLVHEVRVTLFTKAIVSATAQRGELSSGLLRCTLRPK
jgi:hypothetical protein